MKLKKGYENVFISVLSCWARFVYNIHKLSSMYICNRQYIMVYSLVFFWHLMSKFLDILWTKIWLSGKTKNRNFYVCLNDLCHGFDPPICCLIIWHQSPICLHFTDTIKFEWYFFFQFVNNLDDLAIFFPNFLQYRHSMKTTFKGDNTL